MKEKKKEERKNKPAEMSTRDSYINTDPQGSWTGVADDPYEKPIQDADDL